MTTLSKKLLPFLMIPALAIGCADATSDDDTAADEGAFTAATSAELGASVGAIVVNGERLCTAALVKAEAGAMISVAGQEFSAEGRQVVFGGACVGKLGAKHGDFTGAAVFVSQKNGISIKTPIIGFDLQTRASAGLAVGILSAKSEANPIEVLGVSARAGIRAEAAAVFTADENGLLAGASFETSAGFDVGLKTKCTSFKAGASATIGAGASLRLTDGAAIVRVNGKLKFAAYLDVKVDGQCIVAETVEKLNAVGDRLNSLGTGDIVAMSYHPGEDEATMSVYLDKSSPVLRLNSQGRITAKAEGATCDKIQIVIGGPCELAPAGGFSKGWHNIKVDLHHDLFPNGPKGQLVVFSTANSTFNHND